MAGGGSLRIAFGQPAFSENLVALEQCLAERLLDFELLDVVEREAESAAPGLVG